MPNGDHNYLTIPEAETEFGINPNALAFAIQQGRVTAIKRGHNWFITRAEIVRYLKKYKARTSHRAGIVEGDELARWLGTARGRQLSSRVRRANRDKSDVQIVAARWNDDGHPVVLVQGVIPSVGDSAVAGKQVESWFRMPTHKIEVLSGWREVQPP